MKKYLSLTALAGLIALSSCENAAEPPGVKAWRSPNAGSILVYRFTQAQNINGDSSHSTSSVSMEIVEAAIDFWGKSNVSIAIGPEGDTVAFFVDEKGDFMLANRGPESWESFPTGSKGTITLRNIDSTSGDEQITRLTTRTYLGEDYLYFDDKEFHTIKIVQNDRLHERSPFWNYLSIATDTIHFSPDLGFIIRQRTLAENYADDSLWSRHQQSLELNAYILK